MNHDEFTCRRKKRYPSYNQAKSTKLAMEAAGKDCTFLKVYQCPLSGEEAHYHLGNAPRRQREQIAKHLAKKIERQRRKELVREYTRHANGVCELSTGDLPGGGSGTEDSPEHHVATA